jgi:hypothetical protein
MVHVDKDAWTKGVGFHDMNELDWGDATNNEE